MDLSLSDRAEPALQADGSQLLLRSVGKVFGNRTVALQGVDLTIGQGEFVSLLGPSGCGKSTVLRIIAGLTNPTSGRVEWRGYAPDEADIGFVFQEPTLMPWASVFDNVWLPLRLRGVSRAQASDRVNEMLAKVGLAGFERSVPRELSGGMKMRVSIARALVTKPRLLLMDEPFAALDEITRMQLNDDLLSLWQAQRFTAIFVTHSVFESVFLSNRIVVMAARPGRVFEEITIDADYPRGDAFRGSSRYSDCCHTASDSLVRAINAMNKPQGSGAHGQH